MQRRAKNVRVKGVRPRDWWQAGAWITRAVREARAAKRLKRADTKAEKSEVSPPKGRPAKKG